MPGHQEGAQSALTPEEGLHPPSLSLLRGAAFTGISGSHASDLILAEAAEVSEKLRKLDENTWIYIALGAIGLVILIGIGGVAAKSKGGATTSFDASVVLQPHFDIPKGRMEEFCAGFADFYNHINPKAERMLYYGFSVDEVNNSVFCREAYKDADGVLKHLKNVDKPLNAALQIGTMTNLEVHGPASELDKLRDSLKSMDCRFYTTDDGSKLYGAKLPKSWTSPALDNSVIVRSNFHVQDGQMGQFKGMLKSFYSAIKPGEEGTLHYGWAVDDEGSRVLCHESYKDAAGVLVHLENVDSIFKEALNLATLVSLEVHGPQEEVDKLRGALAPLGCKFFVMEEEARTWVHKGKEVSMDNLSATEILQDSAMKVVGQVQTKMEKGSRARDLVEARAMGFTDKAKNFIINELNSTATALLKAIDAEEAKMLLEFNEAVEASFPPVSVLMAGVASPVILAVSLTAHTLEFFGLFLPVLLSTGWSLYEDFGAVCDIPSLSAWTWISFCLSAALTLGHGSLALKIYSGQSALKAKSHEIAARLANNAADGETGISDMQEIFIGSTVLVQEALILEHSIRTSFWRSLIGTSTLLWMICVLWNFVLVVGWTFVPGQIAFYDAAGTVAKGAFCGAWASVFTARVVCLLTPFFFFMNVAQVVQWVVTTAVHSSAISNMLLNLAKGFDENNLGIPIVEILVKALVLRGDADIMPARRTVALGEALRLTKEKEDLEMKLEEVQARINAGKDERKNLRDVAVITGGSMQENIALLEKAGDEDTDNWKEAGKAIAESAAAKDSANEQVTTDKLDQIANYVMEVAEQIKNSDTYQSIVTQAQQTAADAQAAAAEAAVQAQAAAASGLQQAQSGLQAGLEYAQSEEAQAAMAQARSQMEAGAAYAQNEAQSKIQAGMDYAQSEEAQAALAQARGKVEAGIAYAQSEEAQAALSQAASSATSAARTQVDAARGQVESGIAYAQSDEAQAALSQASTAARSQVESGIAYAQSDEAKAAVSQAASSAQAAVQSAAASAQSAAQSAAESAESAAKTAAEKAQAGASDVAAKARRRKGSGSS